MSNAEAVLSSKANSVFDVEKIRSDFPILKLNIGDKPNKPVDSKTLVARVAAVKRHRPDVSVLVRGDTKVDYGKVIYAMSLLQQAGVDDVGLITEPVRSSKQR